MATNLDVRRAVNEANRVFRRYALPICLPLVVVGLPSQFLAFEHPIGQNHITPALAIFSLLLLATGCLSKAAEVTTSMMFLKAQQGVKPRVRQVGEALRSRGLLSVIVGLFARYMLWTAVALLIAVVVYWLTKAVSPALHVTGSGGASGISVTGLTGHDWVTLIFGGILVPAFLYRYVFVLQQFAVAPGSGTDFFDRCVKQANQAWKTAMLLSIGENLTTYLLWHAQALVIRQEPHSAGTVTADLITCILTNGFAAWLVLVRTGLVQQLGAVTQRGVSRDEPMVSGEPSRA
jgi:hypothetical protein